MIIPPERTATSIVDELVGKPCDCRRRIVKAANPQLVVEGEVDEAVVIGGGRYAVATIATRCVIRCAVCQHVATVATAQTLDLISQEARLA